MTEDSSPSLPNPQLSRLRFILLEGESNKVLRLRRKPVPNPPDSQIAYMVHNRQFMRKQYRISAAQLRKGTTESYANRHGLLTTQRSSAALQPNNFLNILRLKAQSPRVRLSMGDSGCGNSSLVTQTESVSSRLQDILQSPGCSCICAQACSCGKRVLNRTLGSTPKDKVESLIHHCAASCGQQSWKLLQPMDVRMLHTLAKTRKSIRRSY